MVVHVARDVSREVRHKDTVSAEVLGVPGLGVLILVIVVLLETGGGGRGPGAAEGRGPAQRGTAGRGRAAATLTAATPAVQGIRVTADVRISAWGVLLKII